MTTKEIKLKIHEESDMFTPLDPDRKQLSDDVSLYLVRNYEDKHRRKFEKFIIRIFTDTPVNEERVKQAIRDHCLQQKSNVLHAMKLETIKEICLAVVGLALLTLWYFLSATREGVWMEVLSIMGWVAIWEATSIAIMRRPELHLVKRTYEKAAKARIEIEPAEAMAE